MEKVKVALLGIGTVGGGVWEIFQGNRSEILKNSGKEIEIVKILVKNPDKKRNNSIPQHLFTADFEEIIKDKEIDIIVEVMGGIEPARTYIMRGLREGKHVVTANKALLANHGDELMEEARKQGVHLCYEASVAGGVPIIHAIKESLTANKIEKVMGILNGTTNYILTKMTKDKLAYHEVLKEAQELGYAEADPTADVEGYDAAHKLTILSSLAFGTYVDFQQVYREGISKISPVDIEYAQELGYVIKLLAIGKAKEDIMELRVHPTFIPQSHPLASVNDAFNAVFVKGDAVGELMFYGRGAGDLPTGSAVVGDIISIVKNIDRKKSKAYHEEGKQNKKIKPMGETEGEYYLRLIVKDRPGVLGEIASIFGRNNVSISSVIQKGEGIPEVSLVFLTHFTREENIQAALKEIIDSEAVVELANLIRVENGRKRMGA